MSVIFDALRRARRRSDAAAAAPSRASIASRGQVPSGLGLTPVAVAPRSGRSWWVVIAAVAVIGVAAWLAIGRLVDPARSAPAVSRDNRPAGGSVPPVTPPAATPERAAAADTAAAADQAARSAPPSRDPASATARTVAVRRESHFTSAVRLHQAGKLDEAAKEYLAAIAENDRHLEARNNLGLLYRARGQTTDAVEQFRRALAIDPRYIKARNHLAVLLIDAGRVADARAEISAGLAADPRNADLLVNLALVERADRRPDRAIELLLRVIGDRPTHAAAHYNLGLLYDERSAATLAYTHYVEFLSYAGPEYTGAVVDEVRRRAETLAGQVGAPSSKSK
jgi:Flp pilus assembly protein TadD